MNPSLNLYPAKIQAQCACAIEKLDEQISALNMLKGSISEFVNDSSIHSVSFDQLKSQCRNYLDVIDAMIYCNEADKADFVTLQGSVGNKDLIGAEIDKWEKYYKQKLEETRNNYENVMSSTVMVSGYAALQMQAYYANLIQMYQQLYDYWYAKELAYYDIDTKTSVLFAKSYGRQAVLNMLTALQGSFKLEEGYNSSVVAAQTISVKNAMLGAIHMNLAKKAIWDALIQSGQKPDRAPIMISEITVDNPNLLNNVASIISLVGYDEGISSAREAIEKINILVSIDELEEIGWDVASVESVNSLNSALKLYGITNRDSIKMFLVTCLEESMYGERTIEDYPQKLYDEGRISYKKEERGVGYIQLTWEESQKKFIEKMGGECLDNNTAEYINHNYDPWYVSAYVWSEYKDCNKICEQYGYNNETLVYTQYAINGWPKGAHSAIERALENGENVFISDESINIGGVDFRTPYGWKERRDAYTRVNEIMD